MDARPTIAVAGAGSIGCFVGGMLAAAGRDVALLARPRVREEIAAHGLHLTVFNGEQRRVAASQLRISDDAPAMLPGASIILVTVKSDDTAAMARLIAEHAAPSAVVVSLQNGVRNLDVLRSTLPGRKVLGAMVPFNVVSLGEGRFHRATSGDIQIERDASGTAVDLSSPDLPFVACEDIVAVQWGKLLVNLNNALIALSGLTLREQLMQRPWRKLLADQMSEGLAAIKAAGLRAKSPTPIPAPLTPHLLRLPDALFAALLGRSMNIDPQARSSMWEDLSRGRPTEVDHLQGEIVAVAKRYGLAAPVNARVRDLVKAAEQAGQGSPGLTAEDLSGSARSSRPAV